MPMIVFLLVVAFSLLQTQPSAGRGGWDERLAVSRGPEDKNSELFSRHLLEEDPPITEEMTQGYMSNQELEKAVLDFGRRCAQISRVYSIGKSVNGFDLWVIEISDKPDRREAEPAFKFIGNVHGDEPVGREVLVLLANWLCSNYMNDSLATEIVNNVHLHILPSMNPDGFTRRKRGNANNVDLNRDFPDQFFHQNDVLSLRQPETMAVMNWANQQQFTASASLHGGALVANYPWDGSDDKRKRYNACPDDQTFRYMASIYSQSHYNMSVSKEFEGGVTNGAYWYPIYGGMQDWNYIHCGCFELTLEISDIKWPKASEIPLIFEHNRISMLNLVSSVVKNGVHGRIFAADTGCPLSASVSITGINYTVSASKNNGDYHRLLAPGGHYEVVASMPGFNTKSTRVILDKGVVNVDFILSPEDGSVHEGSTEGCSCHCSCHCSGDANTLELVNLIQRAHLWLYLLALVILLFLWFMLRRRSLTRMGNHRLTTSKRSIIV